MPLSTQEVSFYGRITNTDLKIFLYVKKRKSYCSDFGERAPEAAPETAQRFYMLLNRSFKIVKVLNFTSSFAQCFK